MDSVLVNTAQTVTNETSLLAIAAKGGFLMVILAVISILAISIIIERLLKYKKLNNNEEEFMQQVYSLVSENNLDKAIHTCEQQNNSPIARIIARAIGTAHKDYLVVKEIAESALKKEVHFMERKLGTLATIAAIAPLIGFLGTVTGQKPFFYLDLLVEALKQRPAFREVWDAESRNNPNWSDEFVEYVNEKLKAHST